MPDLIEQVKERAAKVAHANDSSRHMQKYSRRYEITRRTVIDEAIALISDDTLPNRVEQEIRNHAQIVGEDTHCSHLLNATQDLLRAYEKAIAYERGIRIKCNESVVNKSDCLCCLDEVDRHLSDYDKLG